MSESENEEPSKRTIIGFLVVSSFIAPLVIMGVSKLIDYGIMKYKEKKGIK